MTGKIARLRALADSVRSPGRVRIFYNEVYGWTAATWVRKRGPARSELQQMTQTAFSNVCKWIKVQPTEAVQTAIDQSKNTGFLPRDILMSAAYGRAIEWTTTDGRFWSGVLPLSEEIQSQLDTITPVVGSMLIRTSDGWFGLSPGEALQILEMNPLSGLPGWADQPEPPVQAGIGGGPWPYPSMSSVSQTTGYMQGSCYLAPPNSEFSNVLVGGRVANATVEMTPAVYVDSGTGPDSLYISGPTVTGLAVGINKLPLSEPISCSDWTMLYPAIIFRISATTLWGNDSAPLWYIMNSTNTPPASASTHSTATGGNNAFCWLG